MKYEVHLAVLRPITVFFLLFTVALIPTPSQFEISLGIPNLEFLFTFYYPEQTVPPTISTLMIGYALSLIMLWLRKIRGWQDWAVLVLSTLGLLGYLMEIGRMFGYWMLHFKFSFPVVVAALSWWQVTKYMKLQPQNPNESAAA